MRREIEVALLSEEGSMPPEYATALAAGADVRAFIREPVMLLPGASALIPTGLRVAIPEGFEIQVRPRSGLALKAGVTVLNAPGTVDADYRGEVGVLLINHSKEPFVVEPGMRIAQWILAPVIRAKYVVHESLVATTRGEGGFGHTGIH